MKSFVIPSVFTAIDKFTAPLKRMASGVSAFAEKTEAGVGRAEKILRKFSPAISETQKQLFQFATAAAIAATLIGGIKWGYDSLVKYEEAIASFRTIVSDLSDKEFTRFEKKIGDVANKTRASTIQVAQSFEKIAGLNAEFAKTADGLGQVSEAAIVLSRASKDELGSSAESLVGIMNQFSLKADQANRTINVLAAGTAVGAASIKQTSESFTNFGSVASGANITLEQSVGLVQLLGKYSLFGAEAGTKLRGSVLKLQQAGVGYKSGQFQINDALAETKAKFDKLKTAKQQDAYLNKVFGAENISTGRILVGNIELFKKYTEGVTDTSEAHKAAEINSRTFTAMVEQLKNRMVNWITTSEEAKSVLNGLKKVLEFVGRNFSTIVKVVGTAVGIFAGFWAIMKVVRIALFAYNVVVGIAAARSAMLAVSVGGGTVAQVAQTVATYALIAAQWLWNAAMEANPIFLVIAGCVALGAAVYGLTKYFSKQTTAEKVANEVRERALEKTIDQRVEITLLFNALRKASQGSEEYNSILKKIDQIQPGIIDKYNLQAKAIKNINAAEQELIASIMKRAESEARAELIREKTKKMIENKTTSIGFWESVGYGGDKQAALIRQAENMNLQAEITQLASDEVSAKETINPQKTNQEAIVNNINVGKQKGSLDINIKDDTGKATVSQNADFAKVNLTSTLNPSE